MPFDCGVPPPKSKYDYSKVSFGGIDICKETGGSDDDEDAKWLCSSMADAKLSDINNSDGNEIKEGEILEEKDQEETLSLDPLGGKLSFQQWLERLEDKYFEQRYDLVRELFQSAYNDVKDVYGFLLHVIHKGFFDLYSKIVPLSYYGMDELELWLRIKEQEKGKILEPLQFHKQQACEFVCRSGYNYLDKINKLFQLDKGENAYLADCINLDNLKSKKLKETIAIICALKLQKSFDTKRVAVPLIANDQTQVLETFIGNDKELQERYVELLNDICGMKEEIVESWISENGLRLKDPSKMQRKTLIKIAEKAVKRYNLDPTNYPEIFTSKNIASLNYLVKQRFKEEKSNGNAAAVAKWDQVIENSVSSNDQLQQELVKILINWNEHKAAIDWCHRLDLPFRRLPPEVRDELNYFIRQQVEEEEYPPNDDFEDIILIEKSKDNNSIGSISNDETLETEDWEDESCNSDVSFSLSKGFASENDGEVVEEEFYTLKLKRSNIMLIDDMEALRKAMKVLFQKNQVIGFDTEWKTTFCKAGEQERVSIIQLAIQRQVYIVDLLKLYCTEGTEAILQEFFQRFFTSRDVVKIGFGIHGDIKILMGMFSYVKDYVLSAHHLVDLCETGQKVLSHTLAMPYLYPVRQAALAQKGLSLLVNKTLGKRLDKTFQVSDWERRPLSTEQLHYAAIDAYCLLECYEVLQKINEEAKLNVNLKENLQLKWLKPKNHDSKRKDKYNNKLRKRELIPDNRPLFRGPPRPASSLKVICDTMLQGLGGQLRLCGVDTKILSNHEDHSTAIMISHKEKRIILTRGQPFFMLKGHVSEGMCMFVPDGSLKEQLQMVFTRYNVAAKSKDLMSRCKACNSNQYSYVAPEEVKLAFNLKFDLNDVEMPETQLTSSGAIDLSNYTLVKNGVELQLDILSLSQLERARQEDSPDAIFGHVRLFYICEGCGKIYWEGSHMDRVKKNFTHLLDKSENDKTFYGQPG